MIYLQQLLIINNTCRLHDQELYVFMNLFNFPSLSYNLKTEGIIHVPTERKLMLTFMLSLALPLQKVFFALPDTLFYLVGLFSHSAIHYSRVLLGRSALYFVVPT